MSLIKCAFILEGWVPCLLIIMCSISCCKFLAASIKYNNIYVCHNWHSSGTHHLWPLQMMELVHQHQANTEHLLLDPVDPYLLISREHQQGLPYWPASEGWKIHTMLEVNCIVHTWAIMVNLHSVLQQVTGTEKPTVDSPLLILLQPWCLILKQVWLLHQLSRNCNLRICPSWLYIVTNISSAINIDVF